MLKVGITGGIGSGKTLVCSVFEKLGIPVYSADARAKELIGTRGQLQESIKELFGDEAFIKGEYNRPFIASKVFENKSLLERTNHLIHPAVARDFQQWLQTMGHYPYVLHEAAILVESGSHKLMDHIIFIDAPRDLRIRRVMDRDGVEREKVISRMKNQLPADKIRPIADWTIDNEEKKLILPQILSIHKQLLTITYTHG
jgi:dephospho-CoA kinase